MSASTAVPSPATAPTPAPRPARRSRIARRIALGLLLALLAYAAALGWIYGRQHALLFKPVPLEAAHRFDLGGDVRELAIDVPGARLSALHLRLARPRGVVFFLHGNSGNLQRWFANAGFYRAAGYDLFMVDYRGYGKSTGALTDGAALSDDVRRAWAAMVAEYARGGPPLATLRTVVYGRSLGSGLAAELAAQVHPDLTVLVSPYRSMVAVAREQYWWVPGWLLRFPLRTDQWLPRLRGPVLMVHGEQDTLIPIHHSEALQRLLPRAELLRVSGAGHADIEATAPYRRRFGAALAGL